MFGVANRACQTPKRARIWCQDHFVDCRLRSAAGRKSRRSPLFSCPRRDTAPRGSRRRIGRHAAPHATHDQRRRSAPRRGWGELHRWNSAFVPSGASSGMKTGPSAPHKVPSPRRHFPLADGVAIACAPHSRATATHCSPRVGTANSGVPSSPRVSA